MPERPESLACDVVRVVSPGILTSLQDRGRPGFRDRGIPLSGVMDQDLADVANARLGNPSDAPVLEFTTVGPALACLEDVTLVIAAHGSGAEAKIGDRLIPALVPFRLQRGEHLRIGSSGSAMWGYLAVEGGWYVPRVLGSASMYGPLTPEIAIRKGTVLRRGALGALPPSGSERPDDLDPPRNGDVDLSYVDDRVLAARPGPEWENLSEAMQTTLLETEFRVHPDSSRMAVLLDHGSALSAAEILTGPVQPGTIQLTPSGRVIVLMRDAQTTGGYARVLQLESRAIQTLAQCRPRSRLRLGLQPIS